MAIPTDIIGMERVAARLGGRWPSFHDAVLLEFRVDLLQASGLPSVGVEALLHAFEMTNQLDRTGHYVNKNHTLVRLRFTEVDGLELEYAAAPCILFGLDIETLGGTASGEANNPLHHHVHFHPSCGLAASFECRHIEVLSVEPCTADGKTLLQ